MVNWKNDQKWHCGPTKKYQRRLYCSSVMEFNVHGGTAPEMFAEWLCRNCGRWCGGRSGSSHWELPLLYACPLLLSCLSSCLFPWLCFFPSFHTFTWMENHLLGDIKMHETQLLPSRSSQSDGRDRSRTGNVYLYFWFCLKDDSDKITGNHWNREALLH